MLIPYGSINHGGDSGDKLWWIQGIAYSWWIGWIPKTYTSCIPFLKVFTTGGGGATWQSLIRGGSAPRSNLWPFYRYLFYIPFIEKRYSFHIPTLEQCTFSLSPWNDVNEQYYGKISSITRRNVKQTTSVIYSVHVVKQPRPLPFYILQLVKSLPFYIPEAWKRYPFRAEPPRIGHYREYLPGFTND